VNPINQNLRCNEQIRISPVRVIGENNEQLGILSTADALRMARDAGLDLVEVAPNVRPPVCRLINYGKWKYSQKKHAKKHHHEQQLKEVRLRPKTDTHDRQIKMRHALKFLAQGDKVQFTMVFRGRERMHRDLAFAALRASLDEVGARVKVERPPSMDGRHMVTIVAPVKGAFDAESTDGHAPADKPAARPAPPDSHATPSLSVPPVQNEAVG
jgi:translation initiation factor IF-3